MKSDNRTLSPGERALLGDQISRLPDGLPLTREQCRRALEKAWARSALDLRVIISRFLWLVDPGAPGTEGIRLFSHRPSLGEEELIGAVLRPREHVLAVIREKSGGSRT
jgi:hypothetical protein